jgi:hypothetical protein
MKLFIHSNYSIKMLQYNWKRVTTCLFLPTGAALALPCFCAFPVMPLNIPSVDLTRSQGYDDGDLTARNTLTYNTQRIITMATVSTAESMAPEDSKKRSMVRSQRIFGIELPLMLFFMVILIIGVIGAMPLWIGFFTSH